MKGSLLWWAGVQYTVRTWDTQCEWCNGGLSFPCTSTYSAGTRRRSSPILRRSADQGNKPDVLHCSCFSCDKEDDDDGFCVDIIEEGDTRHSPTITSPCLTLGSKWLYVCTYEGRGIDGKELLLLYAIHSVTRAALRDMRTQELKQNRHIIEK